MKRRSNSGGGDEELRRAWREIKKTAGDDAAQIERYLALLRRHSDPEKVEADERAQKERDYDNARRLLRVEYQESVKSLAEDLVEEIRRGNIADREDLLTHIHETADSNYWVTYTEASQQALFASRHSDAAVEDGLVSFEGGDRHVDRTSVPWAQLAYGALEHDLVEDLESLGIDVNDDSEWPREEDE